MKKYDVITLGIAVMDIIASPVDPEIFNRDNTPIDHLLMVPGGDAVNQANHLAKLGSNVSLCCRIGKDAMGSILLKEVGAYGVDASKVAVSASSVTSSAIVLVSGSGKRNIICKKGNNFDFCKEDIDMSYISNTRALSVGSIFGMPKLEDDGLCEVLRHAKNHGVLTFADMASDKKGLRLKGIEPFLPYIDFFLPSETESEYLTGSSDCRQATQIFKKAGAKNVVIKLGGRGAYADCEAYNGFIDAFDIVPVDTTGSGDAFCAGFIDSMLSGKTLHECFLYASACGAYNSLFFGASTSPLSEYNVLQFMSRTSFEKRY